MAAPTRYSPSYDFTGFQSANPNTPLPADKLEIELNNLALTTGETITNLGLIQRSDGKLNNGIVEFDALSNATKALLGTSINPRGAWAASTAYKVLDMVEVGETTYIAVVDHASGTSFTVDNTSGYWMLWANPGFVDGTSYFQKFSGNGSQTAFTVSQDMGTDENGLMIFINNSGWIPQDPAAYTISGTTLTFLAAPVNGTNNIYVFAPAKILAQAAAYAAAAGTSASAAAASASSASSSAGTASTAATNAGNSATAAAASQSAAATSATNAASSATSAGTSATNAAASASAASTSASGAATSATSAGNSATAAAASQTAAAGSATAAAGSATTASTAATNAGTSATNAAASAVSAAASAALVPLHVFNKTTDPTANDDSGDGYGVGSIWVNTVNDTAYMAVDVTVAAAVWQNIGSAGGISTFAPNKKYSSLKMTAVDGWANGNSDTGVAATHDASAGAVPSFTTAKKRSICIVTVAGTLGGNAVAKGEYLMALQNNPTTADHWAIIADSTTEFNAAIEAAQGSPVALYGTFFLKTANPDAAINLVGDYTILNQCGYPAIYQATNNTRAALQTPRQVALAGIGVATGIDVDDEIGTSLQSVSYFTLVNPADVANFPLNAMVEVFTDAVHVSEAGSSKGYVSNAFRVTSVDAVAGTVYADRVIKYHNKIANASNIYIIPLHEDRGVKIRKGALFMGAPTIIGEEVGWWLTLDGSVFNAGTISGSGSSRTISFTGANLNFLVNQGIRIGLVSGTPESSCKITAFSYSSGVNTITIAVTTKNDKGQVYAAPTSGTIYFNPVWWTSEFDTTTHGRALILQQAHGSDVEVEFARLWAGGCGIRFTHFSKVKISCSKSVNIGTGINSKSWRLIYLSETYCASRNDIEIDNRGADIGARHPYTTSSGTTTSAWAATLWQFRSGCTCENRVKIKSRGDTGPAADTHGMTNGDEIDSDVEYPTSYNTAHSYRGIGAQRRCENGISRHKQRGGQVGFRIANGDYLREPGSIDYVDLEVHDLPLRAGAHGFNGESAQNTPRGLWVQSQAAYTGGAAGSRTLTTGKLNLKNAACGFDFEANTNGKFTSIDHADVGYVLGWVQTAAKVYAKEISADYSIANGVETTSTTSVALGTGTKTFTVNTGLVIDAGSDILVQSAASVAASKANYGWGRVVSYNSGTGALIVYIEGIRGSGTITSWTITAGAKIPRFGVVFSGTGEFTFTTFHWRVGEGANPTEVFHSKDNTGGKVVKGGILIIDDPLNKGMPNIVTSGREADFTVNIGVVIYNGQVMFKGSTTNSFVAGSVSPVTDYQEITADGNWTKPIWATASSLVVVEMIGGGGGGGGGARVVTTGTGGAGGGSGCFLPYSFKASELSGTVACVIGQGGAGGAGATADGTAGSNGVAGTNTTFGAYLTAYAGGYGSGGQLAANSGGGAGGGTRGAGGNGASGAGGTAGAGAGANGGNGGAGSNQNTAAVGGCGGSGSNITTGVAVPGGSSSLCPPGGAAGGGILAGVEKVGGDGVGGLPYTTAIPGGAIGGGAGGTPAVVTSSRVGASGGGGGSNATGVGGAAGASVGYGAGGSGGGAALNGANGGAGAAGRQGVIRVWTYA